jgi:hypothetical protein
MRSVWNYHNSDKMIDVKAKLKIDFGEIQFPLSMDERGRNMSINIMNNIKTPVDFIMDDNPDLTKDEAIKQYNENKAFNENQKAVILPVQQPGVNDDKEKGKPVRTIQQNRQQNVRQVQKQGRSRET